MKIPRQIGLRTLLEIIAVFAFFLWIFFEREAAIRANGRYALQPSADGRMSIVDSQTGRCWTQSGIGGDMFELTPAELKR
jgi:hypothetical protein